MTFLVDRIAAYLCTHGPTSSVVLAKAMGVTTSQATDAVRRPVTRARYGLYVAGIAEEPHYHHTTRPRIWGIHAEVYKDYLASKGMKSKPRAIHVERVARPKAACVKLPKVIYGPAANRPVYTGPMLTRWLPSSPYYKGNLP